MGYLQLQFPKSPDMPGLWPFMEYIWLLQACVNAAEELMNGDYTVGVYNTGNPEDDFHDLFTFGNMSPIEEVLLYRAYSTSDGVSHNANAFATLLPFNVSVTWSLVTSYLGSDGAPYDYLGLAATAKGNDFLTTIGAECDPRLQAIVWIPGQLMFEADNYFFEKPPLDGTVAYEQLNLLRARAGLPGIYSTNRIKPESKSNSKSWLEQLIDLQNKNDWK